MKTGRHFDWIGGLGCDRKDETLRPAGFLDAQPELINRAFFCSLGRTRLKFYKDVAGRDHYPFATGNLKDMRTDLYRTIQSQLVERIVSID
ncbi:hypothetical protein N183_36290 [Sinorhizobium sp. Sb3]|nr:hypothetical protein N183_36290 [Sinorhizobium sp. Sb3]